MESSTNNTVYESVHYITGRGLVYVVDTKKENVTIKLGDTVCFDDTLFTVRGLEMTRNGFGDIGPVIGVLVRPYKNPEEI
jgi:hypothetical protein